MFVRRKRAEEREALVKLLEEYGYESWLARNIAWWRYSRGLSLVPRKVVTTPHRSES